VATSGKRYDRAVPEDWTDLQVLEAPAQSLPQALFTLYLPARQRRRPEIYATGGCVCPTFFSTPIVTHIVTHIV
jgi:hypothetical protein